MSTVQISAIVRSADVEKLRALAQLDQRSFSYKVAEAIHKYVTEQKEQK